jgi:hypothetical protein
MRFYNVIRFGTYKIRYAEIGRTLWEQPTPQEMFKKGAHEVLTVPSTVPKVLDPFLLWKQTVRREPFHILEIQDMTGQTWFETKSSMPLAKIMEISNDVLKEMS